MRSTAKSKAKRPLERARCVVCGARARNLVSGRCPTCERVRAAFVGSDWTPLTQFLRLFDRGDGRTLGCVVSKVADANWVAMAIVTPTGGTIESVFGDHSHQLVGHYASIDLTIAAAESYATSWLKGHKTANGAEACACKEIPS